MKAIYGSVHGAWDYAGLAEVAEYMGVTKQCIGNWRNRYAGIFPTPIAELSMGPIWRLCDIRDWARTQGKGPYEKTD